MTPKTKVVKVTLPTLWVEKTQWGELIIEPAPESYKAFKRWARRNIAPGAIYWDKTAQYYVIRNSAPDAIDLLLKENGHTFIIILEGII